MTFTDWLVGLAENGGVVAWGPGRSPIVLAPAGRFALPPPTAAPGLGTSGRGGSLSRSVCDSCGTESLSTAPELLRHVCGEG